MKTIFNYNYRFSIGLCTVLILLLTSSTLVAQEEAVADEAPASGKLAIGISTGTHALYGVDLAFQVAKPLTVKVAYNALSLSYDDLPQQLNGINVLIDATLLRDNVTGLLEWAPTKKRRFRIVAGAGYFFDNQLALNMQFDEEGTSFNDITLTKEELGELNGTTTFQSINPYVGIGFGRSVPSKKRVSLGLDLGSYYLGSSEVILNATDFLKGNKVNQAPLQENLDNTSLWWPVVSLRLGVKIL